MILKRQYRVKINLCCGFPHQERYYFSCRLLSRLPLLAFYVIAFTALQCLVVYRPFSDLSLNIEQWTVCLLLSVIPTVFAIIFLYKAIERIGSSYASIFSSVEPAVTIIASAILLKDPIKALQVLGMVFIIAGIVVPNLRLITRR